MFLYGLLPRNDGEVAQSHKNIDMQAIACWTDIVKCMKLVEEINGRDGFGLEGGFL